MKSMTPRSCRGCLFEAQEEATYYNSQLCQFFPVLSPILEEGSVGSLSDGGNFTSWVEQRQDGGNLVRGLISLLLPLISLMHRCSTFQDFF